MSDQPEKWHIREDMTIEQAEKAIEQIVISAINQLESIKGLFKKDKEKLERTVELLKILGAYIFAIHTQRKEAVNNERGLQGSSEKDQKEGDKGTDGVPGIK